MIQENNQSEVETLRQEVYSMRSLVETLRIESAVMQKLLQRLDESLFGGDNREGVIDSIQKKLNKHDRIIWVGLGFIAALNFVSGSGLVSLKSFLGK